MKIKDITNAYVECILKKGDLSAYEKSFPELFEHYVTYWAKREYWHQELGELEVGTRRDLVLGRLPVIEKELMKHGFDVNTLEVVLMVGQGTTNGHAFRHDDGFAVFLPVEGYESIDQVDIFVTHEILHALHYAKRPEFYFKTKSEKDSVLRQLMTEGLATYLTGQVLCISDEKALWASVLTEEEVETWMEACRDQKGKLFEESKLLLQNDSTETELFYANDSSDVRTYRAGYFIGLELVKEMVKSSGLSTQELMTIDRARFENMANDILS